MKSLMNKYVPGKSLRGKGRVFILAGVACLGLAACNALPPVEEAYYWGRTDVTEAAYLEGPKAQQMLHRDISRCVVEIREMERLGSLRNVLPADTRKYGIVPDPATAQGQLAEWETPTRDGYLRAEFSDYQDFETCMQAKGWQRMEHMPFEMAERSRKNYLQTIRGQSYQSKTAGAKTNVSDKKETEWDKLND